MKLSRRGLLKGLAGLPVAMALGLPEISPAEETTPDEDWEVETLAFADSSEIVSGLGTYDVPTGMSDQVFSGFYDEYALVTYQPDKALTVWWYAPTAKGASRNGS